MKMKKVFKATLSMALSIAMLVGVASAATMNNIPVVKDGTLTKVNAERLSTGTSYAQNDDIMIETQLTFSIPAVKKTTYSLYSREEIIDDNTYQIYRAATEDGEDIENVKLENGDYKYYVVNKTFGTAATEADQLMEGGSATVVERDANGDLILETTKDGEVVMSTDKGVLTAQTYWNGYLFTAWSFIGTQNADYHTNLVIYDLDTMAVVASYNLKDLGMKYDWYHEGLPYFRGVNETDYLAWAKTGDTISNANNWSLPAITGLYVDDDYLLIKGLNTKLIGNVNKFFGHNEPGQMLAKLYNNPVGSSDVNEIGTLKLGATTWLGGQVSDYDGTGTQGGLRMMLEYGADVVRIGDYIVDAYPFAENYKVYSISDSGITKAGEKSKSALTTLLGATSLTMYDVDYEGSDMYITYNDGSNLKVARVDITDPLNPVLKWANTINKTISYLDGETTVTTPTLANPELEISGNIAVISDRISSNVTTNRDAATTVGRWVIVLDMSDKSTGASELLWYDTSKIHQTTNYSPAVMYSVICGQYIINTEKRVNNGNVGITMTRLNGDKTSIDIADYMKLTDNGTGEMINGMFTYEGKVFVSYMDNSASTGKAGRISVLTPVSASYTVTFKDGSNVTTQTVNRGENVTAPSYTAPEGYTFKGWAIEGTTEVVDLVTYLPTADVTFVPICEYSVTFRTDAGDAVVESSNSLITPPEAPVAPEGFKFNGWAVDGTSDVTDFSKAVTAGTVFVPIFVDATWVTNEAELRYAIENASTDAENPTTITLANDIEVTTTKTTSGNFEFVGKYVTVTGGHDIIKAHKSVSRLDWSGRGGSAFIIVDGGEVTFDGVGIDMNIDDDRSNGGRAFYVHTTVGGKITVKNATIKDGGFAEHKDGSHIGMVAFVNNNGTFVLGENTKVTGFTPYEADTDSTLFGIANDWYTNGTGILEINGAEVYGNAVNGVGLIYGYTSSTYILSKGYFHNNTNPSGYALYSYGAGNVNIGGDMQLDGTARTETGTVTITSKLKYPLILEKGTLSGSLKTSEENKDLTYAGYYGDVIATGTAAYSLTANDLTKLGYADKAKKLYIDTTPSNYGNVYMQDADKPYWPTETNGTMIGDSGILTVEEAKKELTITDAILTNGKVTVTYSLTGDEGVTGKPIAAIFMDGVLRGVNYDESETSVAFGTAKTIDVAVPSDWTTIKNAAIKVFIWAADGTIKPLIDAAEYTAQ